MSAELVIAEGHRKSGARKVSCGSWEIAPQSGQLEKGDWKRCVYFNNLLLDADCFKSKSKFLCLVCSHWLQDQRSVFAIILFCSCLYCGFVSPLIMLKHVSNMFVWCVLFFKGLFHIVWLCVVLKQWIIANYLPSNYFLNPVSENMFSGCLANRRIILS